ncbi:tyrosine-type recombinase/integrase [Sphingomicrobium sp. XHP0239]|uniref:tyrosine-type recombinase/integrase n=1 Tax=Sphingomicrobium maritimum TaxID=3133972 RepID=UPI0031CC594E
MSTIAKREWTTACGEKKTAWRLRYVDAGGTPRQKTFAKKGDASAYRDQLGYELRQGIHTPDSASTTVAVAGALWLDGRKLRGLERSTTKSYDEILRLHIEPLIGEEKLSRLTKPRVRLYVDALLGSRSRAMAAKALRQLVAIINDAQERGLVAQNVAKDVTIERAPRGKSKVVVPTKPNLKAMIAEAAENHADYHPMLLTAIFTGMRSSELRGFPRSGLDLKAATCTVTQRADQWGVIGAPKSKAGYRTIPIPPMLVKALREWMLRSPPSDLLFPNSDGGVRLHSNMLNREYWPLQVDAGVVKGDGKALHTFHELRHAAASAWITQKVDLKRLTTWLGHSSIQTTLDVYGHLIKDDEKDAAIAAAAERELLG